MGIGEALIGGIRVLNRNWQLVLVHLVMAVINCVSILFILILPLLFVSFILGFKLSSLQHIYSPHDLITMAPGIILFGTVLFFVYIIFITMVGLFVFSGSAGVIARTVEDEKNRFSLKGFFSYAKRFFFPVLSYSALIGLIALVILGVFAVLFIALPFTSITLKGISGITTSVVTAFISIILFLFFIILISGLIGVFLYGVAHIVFQGRGSFATLHETVGYIFKTPLSIAIYVIAVLIYFIVNITAILIGVPFQSIPGGIGIIFSVPLQLFYYAFQSYTGLWILSVILLYYYNTVIKPPEVLEIEGTTINEE